MGKTLEFKGYQIPYFAPGDGRTDANLAGQQSQLAGEAELKKAFDEAGTELVRLHPEIDARYGHGFIQDISQATGTLSQIPKNKDVIAFLTQWAFNDRTAPLLWEHNGPILVASNFSGTDPGLVGALGLRSCLAMHEYRSPQKGFSFLWSSQRFEDKEARAWIREFLNTGKIDHSALLDYKKDFDPNDHPEYSSAIELGKRVAQDFEDKPRHAAVYDLGCMGMLNAAWDERDMVGTGVRLARLNQVELLKRMKDIPVSEARGYIKWLEDRGFRLQTGDDDKKDITERMVIESGQMYGAHVKWVYGELGFDAATIAFQTGMNSSCASSDLPEAMCNSTMRPPVYDNKGRKIRKGLDAMLNNEADIPMMLGNLYQREIYRAAASDPAIRELIDAGGAFDALLSSMIWVGTGHDVRWGDMSECKDGTAKFTNGKAIKYLNAFVLANNLSGNMPVEHTQAAWSTPDKLWSDFTGKRHSYKYFGQGGICTEGLARPGEGIWNRIYKIGNERHMDIGRFGAVNLSSDETERIWSSVTRTWPLQEAVMYGVSRDSLMAGHMSNHIDVSYAPDANSANVLMMAMASLAHERGYKVHLCGSFDIEDSIEHKVKHNLAVEGPYLRTAK